MRTPNFLSRRVTVLLAAVLLLISPSAILSTASAAPTTAPTLEQRVAYAEAERSNSDPSATGIAPSAFRMAASLVV